MKLTSNVMTDDVDDDDDRNTNFKNNQFNEYTKKHVLSAANYIQEILEVIICI